MNAPECPDSECCSTRQGPLVWPAWPTRRAGVAPRVDGGLAWDSALHPMAQGARTLVMQASAVAAKGTDPARQDTEWLLRFAPTPACSAVDTDDTVEIAYLGIRGVSARALRCVSIHTAGAIGLEIDSLADARGQLITAGELVDSMAWASGLPNMVVDTRGRGLRWPSATVTLRIQSDGPEGPEGTSVTVSLA